MLAFKGSFMIRLAEQFTPIKGNSPFERAAINSYTKGTRAMSTIKYTPPPIDSQEAIFIGIEDFLTSACNFFPQWIVDHIDADISVSQTELEIEAYESIIRNAQQQIEILRELRTEMLRSMPYPKYLKTNHWKNTRKTMLAFADHRCQLCNTNKSTLHVHHRTYENRGCETVIDLIVLCEKCHETFHDKLAVMK